MFRTLYKSVVYENIQKAHKDSRDMLGWGTRRRYTVAMVAIVTNFHLALYTQGEIYVSPPTFLLNNVSNVIA